MAAYPIGNDPVCQWIYDPSTGIIDLTRNGPAETALTIQTTTNPIRIDPAKTAMVIVDMQNFFLHPALGRSVSGSGLDAVEVLLNKIPAAREKGIRILWVNWGLTDDEVATMPPAMMKAFTVLQKTPAAADDGRPKKEKNPDLYKGLGMDIGAVELPDGTTIEAGGALMRDTWNAALYGALDAEYRKGLAEASRPDVWIHKNRMSALWGPQTDLQNHLQADGITTLLFAGVNTDQCVGGTLMDAFSKGYDCILLKDGAATTSPQFATDAWEWNSENTFGFVTSCSAL
ncbi:Isochorismatase-like protein [Penicillium sp. IBT 16267x]|nr:Isochorismatase-like protein [Penicillium sp. IBT 16267x]